MEHGTLTQSVKTRIPGRWKNSLEAMAEKEHLAVSDIVRRAIAEFIDRRKRTKQGVSK